MRVQRSFNYGNVSPVATDAGGVFTSALTQLPSSAEFTTLFQEYRIVWTYWEVSFLPSTGGYSPILWYGLYRAGQFTAPTTLDEVLQLTGQRKYAFGPDKRTVRIGYKPMVRTGDSVQQMRPSPWIALASSSAAHFGLWYWLQFFNTTDAPGSKMSITGTHQLEFRGTQ